jgi:YesN/AraC family two-component response regulator
VACLLFLGEKEEMISYAKSFLDDTVITVLNAIYGHVHHQETPEYNAALMAEDSNLMVLWDYYNLIHCKKIEEALERLTLMVAQRIGQIINFQFDPFLKPLRQAQIFKDLQEATFGHFHNTILPDKVQKTDAILAINTKESEELKSALNQVMENDQAFLRSDLSLRSLAEEVNVHPNSLSKFINDTLQTNFTDLVNGRRLEHFQKIALLPENSNLTMLGLAYESGFNSKTVFNTYFKKMNGKTPKQWVKEQQ